MSHEKKSYLESELGARYVFGEESIEIIFQRERIRLKKESEIGMLDEVGSSLSKEVFFSENELVFKYQRPLYYKTFSQLKNLDEKSRYLFASQLVKRVREHRFSRLHLFICPENLLIDDSLTPHFLHYGVKESIPPYENESEKRWNELKAAAAAAIDDTYSFEQYLQLHQSLALSDQAAASISAENEQKLLDILSSKIKEIEHYEQQLKKVPQKKWKNLKYSFIAAAVLLVPLLAFLLYTLIITYPKHTAFMDSHEHFLKNEYSQVIDALSPYQVDDMHRVTQYELAHAYLVSETLSENQKDNILNTITLQSDPRYAQYWIHMGRGEPEESLIISRQLEDYDLIMYALIQYEEAVKADADLDEEERQQELNNIGLEKEEYERLMEEQREAAEEETESQEATNNTEAEIPADEPNQESEQNDEQVTETDQEQEQTQEESQEQAQEQQTQEEAQAPDQEQTQAQSEDNQ